MTIAPLTYPDRGDFTGTTRIVEGKPVFKSDSGKVTHVYKNEQDWYQNSIVDSLMAEYNRQVDAYLTDKRNNPNLYIVAYNKAHIVEKALLSGFLPTEGFDMDFQKAKSNWYGVSRQSPDLELRKGVKTILLSLNGLFTDLAIREVQDQEERRKLNGMQNNMSIKLIALKVGQHVIFNTFFGELPSSETLDLFYKTDNL